MKILVTGGAGFLGSHLCQKLLFQGHEVIILDDLSTGSRNNIIHLLDDKNFSFVEWDITKSFLHLFNSKKIDQIYHLACPASPIQYEKDPLKTIKTNILGTENVLELAKVSGSRVLLTSTSEIYGEPLEHPQKETYRGNVNTMGPRACYDEGKRLAETLMAEYHRIFGIEIRIARIFNTYGPRLSSTDGRVVSNFIIQALNNEDITIFGDGSQSRSFCYVDDLVKGFLSLMAHPSESMPVNLGNNQEFTILELAQKIISLTRSKSKIAFKELPEDDPTRRQPDITKAKKILGWSPEIDLDEGLSRTINYFSQMI